MSSAPVSKRTKRLWIIDAGLLISAIVAIVSGVYFLFFPQGFQGGRNPFYSIRIIFTRTTWDLLHTWLGIAMIIIATIHFLVHWDWVVMMAKKIVILIQGKACGLSSYGQFNVWLDFVIGLSFFIAAISGVYFLISPTGSLPILSQDFIFSRTVWDLIHTWSGIVMTITALIHFGIHWRWVVNVSRRIFVGLFSKQVSSLPAGSNAIETGIIKNSEAV